MNERETAWEKLYDNDEERAWAYYLANPFRPETLRRWWKNSLTKIRWSSNANKIPRKAA